MHQAQSRYTFQLDQPVTRHLLSILFCICISLSVLCLNLHATELHGIL